MGGQVAQLVEQWTENPRVGGSIPPLATMNLRALSGPSFNGRAKSPANADTGVLVVRFVNHAANVGRNVRPSMRDQIVRVYQSITHQSLTCVLDAVAVIGSIPPLATD